MAPPVEVGYSRPVSLVGPTFAGLLALVFVAHWSLPVRWRSGVLVAGSATFYGWVHPWMALLLVATACGGFSIGLAIDRWRERRGGWLALSVAGHLGVLGAFKYADWGLSGVELTLGQLGVDWTPPALGWLWPLGVSFYTFQVLGYTIDVYRGARPERHLVDFLAFAMMFPPLVAGPIERAAHLLPQIRAERRLDFAVARSGLTLAAWGAVQKVVLADTLAPYVEGADALTSPPGVLTWAAALGFGVRLYADLAGYTNLARGLARLFGIELSPNFDQPFLAVSTPDFWRRWHLSLSLWVRDYLLFPLLGSGQVSGARLALATATAFVVIGAWHGPGWSFVAFGAWHGAWSLLYRPIDGWLSRLGRRRRVLAAVVHAAVVLVPGSFWFRGPTVAAAADRLLSAPWQGSQDAWTVALALLALTACAAAVLAVEPLVRGARGFDRVGTTDESPWTPAAQATCWVAALWALVVFHPLTTREFVYLQF